MNIFDDIQRFDHEPTRYSEPTFTFMNRTVRSGFEAVRKKMEGWFSRYPQSEQPELRERLRSTINSQHRSAFFELLLHELLLVLGCQITLHPEVPGTRAAPDFLVVTTEGSKFYLEAALVTNESGDEAAAQARINVVYDVLDRKVDSSNFFLWVHVEGAPDSPPPANKIASFLNGRLVELDPDVVTELYELGGWDAIPPWRFDHDGWVVGFQPIPKKPEARNREGARPIGAQDTGVHRVDYRTPIRDSINKKAGRYGDLDLPYVIAVNVLEHIDEIDIEEALFGKEEFTVIFSQSSPMEILGTRASRKPDGVWTSYGGPRNTRVSAILLAANISPWALSSENVRLYHNHRAQRPYSSVLTRLPQAVVEDNRIKKIAGESIGTILGLPPLWPIETA